MIELCYCRDSNSLVLWGEVGGSFDKPGLKIKIVCDTGATVSCISRSMFERLNKNNKYSLGERCVLNNAGKGSTMEAFLCKDLPLKLGESKATLYHWDTYVTDIEDQFILGLDFLEKNCSTIDLSSMSLHLQENRANAMVKLRKNTVFLPNTINHITVDIVPPLPEGVDVLIEPIPGATSNFKRKGGRDKSRWTLWENFKHWNAKRKAYV